MSDLIERAFAAVPPSLWSDGKGGEPSSMLAETRARLRQGLCPGCGSAVTLPGWKALLCPACRPRVGYCARCERVQPLAAFGPPKPSDRGMVCRSYCRVCEAALARARRNQSATPPPPCVRCKGERVGRHKLCATCRATHGYCGACGKVKPLSHFGPAPTSKAAARQHHAGRCRWCDARRVAKRRREAA